MVCLDLVLFFTVGSDVVLTERDFFCGRFHSFWALGFVAIVVSFKILKIVAFQYVLLLLHVQ